MYNVLYMILYIKYIEEVVVLPRRWSFYEMYGIVKIQTLSVALEFRGRWHSSEGR